MSSSTTSTSAQNQPPKPMPKLTLEQAREAIDLCISKVKEPENRQRFEDIVTELEKEQDPMIKMQKRMTTLLPAVQEVLGDSIKHFGFDTDSQSIMNGIMQIQSYSLTDPIVANGMTKIMRAMGGDFSAILEEDDDECEEVE
ncbi:hypothetical protein FOL47_000133 [Perkinsus chesapeaki]|uniref:Protein C10 n=1 Tax=Perkinsus chesapeaki TaxID=330153 RepID=A0A7J6N3Z8_PERCH|nr:hypothetical protein FOL47_000133 [Perkinsus chesapeaki]|mmetsp:Transcript_7790/g.8730  ORF Transcript_7790/g.8730 Transcript_7790/m.8730 type:complete len:142 (+) Transcript_7790:57-482(+)